MMVSKAFRTGRRVAGALALGSSLALGACSNSILQANDPDLVTSADSPNGALALKSGVIQRFQNFTNGAGGNGPDNIFQFGGLLADEWISGDTFEQRNTVDARTTNVTNSFLAGPFRTMQRTRVEGREAIKALRRWFTPTSTNVALMFALTAFAENQIGETFCNGIPFSDVNLADASITYGNPVTVDSAFKRAINDADSALQNNSGVASEVTRMANLASIVKARALMNRGTAFFAAAAAAVAAVPTNFTYTVTYSANTFANQNFSLNQSAGRYSIAESEGGNGLNFRTAGDPRLPIVNAGRNAFDSQTPFFYTTLWGQYDPVIVASGIEARLIEAEAALFANSTGTWLSKLNEARATKAGLAPLPDPGTADARVNLTFRERAFWMFSTGHRLGDLRRLIRQYGRNPEATFPSGAFAKGGVYGTDVNFPISFDELNNPAIPQTPQTQTKSTCIDRNA